MVTCRCKVSSSTMDLRNCIHIIRLYPLSCLSSSNVFFETGSLIGWLAGQQATGICLSLLPQY